MPPGPAYNWFCVLYSAAEILSHAARYRAAQVSSRNAAAYANPRKRRRTEEPTDIPVDVVVVEDVSIATRGVHDSLHEDTPLPVSQSSANATTITAIEDFQPPKSPHEFPDAYSENIEKEPVLQQLVRGKFLPT
jgi:hypothetical protein